MDVTMAHFPPKGKEFSARSPCQKKVSGTLKRRQMPKFRAPESSRHLFWQSRQVEQEIGRASCRERVLIYGVDGRIESNLRMVNRIHARYRRRDAGELM